MTKEMHIKLIFKQILADLIGKDSHRGVTLSYAWACNQFGHFSLGFIPTLLVYILIQKNGFDDPSLVATIAVSTWWLIFELFNFIKPLMWAKKNISNNGFFECCQKGETAVFSPKWFNIAYDTFTDLCFFWLGAFSITLFHQSSFIKISIVIILVVLVLVATKYWYITKIYQSIAGYPFQIRLCQWKCNLEVRDKDKVIQFIEKNNTNNHLFVFGSHGAGKSELSVAMLNELSIKNEKCTYITANKLFRELMISREVPKIYERWNWMNTDYLVIDDVNPGEPIDTIVDPNVFLNIIDRLSKVPNNESRSFFNNKSIIWVLGNINEVSERQIYIKKWSDMLENLGIERNRIESVILEN